MHTDFKIDIGQQCSRRCEESTKNKTCKNCRHLRLILQNKKYPEEENKQKPLSDEKLTEQLQEKGYNIARRTVAKYREQLNIPVARLRKEL